MFNYHNFKTILKTDTRGELHQFNITNKMDHLEIMKQKKNFQNRYTNDGKIG